jgi:tetratricopeptide (TPR) repeat protein
MLTLKGYVCLPALALAASVLLSQDAPTIASQLALANTPSQIPSTAGTAAGQSQLTPADKGDEYLLQHRYQEAVAAYAKSPDMTADIWNKMGMANELMVNLDEAGRCYNESLKLSPNDPRVLNNLATLHESRKDFGTADRLYRKALKLDPNFALYYKNFGTNLIALKKYREGWEAYKQALALDPGIFAGSDFPQVGSPAAVYDRGAMNYYMARACLRTGQKSRALEFLRQSINEGFIEPEKIASDREFASLSDDPGFKKLLADESRQ